MATTQGTMPVIDDKTKDWQLELLMEKLRSKSSQFRTFPEISKSIRMVMLDKRFSLDSVEKSQHQRCLDTLQHCIKVTSLQSMIERLESLTRQLGLKFMVGPSGVEVFISSDMFYLEIILEQSGDVRDVKVHHEDKAEQSCMELVSCLSKQDFDDFTAQLEGFASIYQLNAEKKIKRKAFTALQSLESDLNTLAQLQTFMKEPFNLLHKSPVGILEQRRGGHPMKLTYFVSPYDLIDTEKGELEPITIERVIEKNLGYSVTVCMEGSAAHKLQTTTLISVNRNVNGKSTPTFATLTNVNSAVIPACFVLKLNSPMPMCASFVKQIQQLTELECADVSSTHPLLSLIAKHSSDGKLDTSTAKGFFVSLPDQNHCYFMTENKSMEGTLVHSIPFTHPGHVSQILVILRQQALFNTLVASCIRPNSKQDFENMIMFEISALSWTHVSISLEHPIEETMATAELDLSDISNLLCSIHSPGSSVTSSAPDTESELATKILNRCLSIPVTMRAVIKLWDKQVVRKNNFSGHENFSLPLGPGDPGGPKGPTGDGLNNFGGLDGKMKQEPNSNGNLPHAMNLSLISQSHQGVFLNESMIASANFSHFPTSDTPVLTNMELTNILSGTGHSEKQSKRQHKRRASEDPWKSLKRKSVEDPEMLLECSSNDSTSRSTLLSQEAPSEMSMMTPNSALGFHSDLELSGLDPAEIIAVSEKSISEFDNIDELGDVEDILAATAVSREPRSRELQKSPSSIDFSDSKTLVPPTVSITTVPPQGFHAMGGLGIDRRTGVELVPLSTTPPTSIPSSLTITPISSSQMKSLEERSREKKSGKSRSDEKNRLDKKRKRKRDDSPMGPPDKIPSKQDPLSKPVSVSIKPAESPPLPLITPTSPNMIRKFTASPTQGKTFSVSGKLSPSSIKSSKSGSSHHSPKHSPAHVPNSPKHIMPGISSPKSHGTSPKHPSSGSGKPSMSTLKTAANSPSSKSNNDPLKKSQSKDGSRDKDKKFGFSSNKTKTSVKLKQLDVSGTSDINLASSLNESIPSPTSATDLSKSGPAQIRNRKGSLSAIVDKLKSAQHCDGATDLSTKSGSSRERSGSVNKIIEGSKSSSKVSGENKNSEYMVKPSSDGIKLTINKTRTKESSKSSTKSQLTSGTGSPKTHTGLKPGVNSGPASKKPQQLIQKSSNSPNVTQSSSPLNYGTSKSSSSSNTKLMTPKGISLLNNSGTTKSKSSSATDLSRNKDKLKLNKSGSEKSIFSSSRDRKSSPTQNREETDSEKAFKLAMSKMDPYSTAPLMAEGLIKQLDKNFQIPKLSARNAEDKKGLSNKTNTISDTLNNISSTKMYDIMSKNDIGLPKYPLTLPSTKLFENSMEAKIRNSMNVMAPNMSGALSLTTSSSPKSSINMLHKDLNDYNMDISENDRKKDIPQLHTGKEESYKHNFPISKFFPSSAVPSDLSSKSVDLSSKYSVHDGIKDSHLYQKDLDVLLDFSSSSKMDKMCDGALQQYPSTSSVSVHIVKSPAPIVHIDSASSCITDDELMDEALVGMGK